jgi:hypothetical protein
MVKYDPDILRKYANQFYMKANLEILGWSVVGLFLGAVLGVALLALKLNDVSPELLFLGALVGGAFLGFLWGREKAFMLKVQAQQILCQVEIEQNTRTQAVQAAAREKHAQASEG